MKNLFKTLAIVALGLFATSCATDFADDVIVSGSEVTVSFSTGVASRADISDGTTATDLVVAVYKKDGNVFLFSETATFTNRLASVDLKLVQGMTYNIAFWAQSPNAPYVFDPATGKVEMNYTAVAGNGNDEDLDAFFHLEESLTVNGPDSKRIELYRPFAQVNLGTSDLADAERGGYTDGGLVAELQAYPTFNILTKAAEGTKQTLTFDAAAAKEIVDAGQVWPGSGTYDWLSMNYILVGAERESIDVTYTIKNTAGIDIEVEEFNVPVQRNYRTNLVGSVLTNNIGLEIEIIPAYTGVYDDPTGYYVSNGVYHITSAVGLDYFAEQVAAGNSDWVNATIVLDSDIDLSVSRASGDNWTPIGIWFAGNSVETMRHTFRGTFDGAGHTISNMVVTDAASAGLFAYTYGCTIKNLTIENPTVTSNHYAGAILGWCNDLVGNDTIPMIIENCHVVGGIVSSTPEEVGGSWDNGDKVGGLVGYLDCGTAAHPDHKVSGCSVSGTEVKAYRDFGGLVGYVRSTKIVDCVVSGITLTQDLSHDYKSPTPTTYGPFVGRNDGGCTLENNVVDGSYRVGDLGVAPLEGEEAIALSTYYGEEADVVLPNEVNGLPITKIGRVFDSMPITSIVLPNQLEVIGNRAFRMCPNLSSIELPATLTTIESGAFQGCPLLTSVVIPAGVTTIGDQAFYGCSALASINIPDGIEVIEASAFRALAVTTLDIPASVTSIGSMAFRDNKQLTTINYAGTKEQWRAIPKGGSWALIAVGYFDLEIVCTDGSIWINRADCTER